MNKDNFSHLLEACLFSLPANRIVWSSRIDFPNHKVLEYLVHSFPPKSDKCFLKIELLDAQEEDIN